MRSIFNASDLPTDWECIVAELTRREAEVAGLVSLGLANKAIAGQLGVAEGTVKIHLYNIYRKLRVSNRVGLILSAAENRV
jgi:two-component system nitrate/nitrite response regulator NarL